MTDLSPLKGMPLPLLSLLGCPKVKDLGLLRGMPGLDVVRNMSRLTTIDNKPAAQFWKEHDAKQPRK